ncbi:MAG: MFS transporter [Anaerolineae bacterium]
MQPIARQLLFARIAVSVVFFTVGAVFANWVSRIPEVKTELNLTEGTLGLALMVLSIGVILGLLITGGLIARFGSRRVSIVGAIALTIALAGVSLATNFATLGIALFFLGAFNSIADVAMNAQGVEVELRSKKQIMNSFHAFWSVGLFSGALMGSGFVTLGFTFRQHFLIVPIFFILLMLIAQRYLLVIDGEQNSDDQATVQLPHRALWGLGVLAFAAGLSEGAIIDWGGLYLHDIVGTTEAVAALGLAAFSFTMVVMRFIGDAVAERVGAVRLVRLGGVGVVLGVGLAVMIPTFWATVIGFSVAGIGLAVAIPLAFSAAGKMPGIPSGRAIASVATIGYAAFLIGPPVIGFIAEATSLRLALIVVMVIASTIVFSAGALNPRKHASN